MINARNVVYALSLSASFIYPILAQAPPGGCGLNVVVYHTNYIKREAGNSVYAYADTSITGSNASLWVPWINTWLYTNGVIKESRDRDEQSGPAGGVADDWLRRYPSEYGVGTYKWDSHHRAYAQACNQWAPPYLGGWNGDRTAIQPRIIKGT